MFVSLSDEDVLLRLEELRQRGIEMLGGFRGTAKIHTFRCQKNHEWKTTFNNVYRGKNCCFCTKHRLTDDDKRERVEKLKIERNILMLEPLEGTNKRYWFRCLLDNHEWKTSFACIYNSGQGCPKCSHSYNGEDKIKTKIDDLKPRNIKMLDGYKGVFKKHRFLCILSDCNHEWSTTFDAVNRGTGCPKCSGRYIDPIVIKKQVESLIDRNIKMVDDYKSSSYKNTFECLVDGYKWKTKLYSIYVQGSGCPKCAESGFNCGKSATLYYIRFEFESKLYYKIGITNRKVSERFATEKLPYRVLKTKVYPIGGEAYSLEQHILKEFREYKYRGKPFLVNGNTELFDRDVLQLDSLQ